MNEEDIKVICYINQIINELEEKDRKKIPLSVRSFFEKNSIKGKYILDFSIPIREQINKETEDVLVYIYSYLKEEKSEKND